MKYRKFGKLNIEVSALGFGCMRLPVDAKGDVNEPEAIRMIRHAIDSGVNYVDTAYGYHGGNSEIVTGRALKDGYREKVMLATKSPVWLIKGAGDFDRLLDEQLKKLQTDHIDFYLLHSLSRNSWRNTVLKYNVLERAEAAKKSGKIKHLGFSFHDDGDAFIEIIDGYDKWEFCQIQYNYMDIENQAGVKGLKYAASKGLGIVIMEPLLGGKLAAPPADIRKILESSPAKRSAPDWALQWLWDQPEVSLILSGMTAMRQVEDNLVSADKSAIGSFGPEDRKIIEAVRARYNERSSIPCTACQYCMPCPNNVNIPENFRIYNQYAIYEYLDEPRRSYNNFFPEPNRASACIQCGVCETKCPQKIPITEWMPRVHETLGQ